MYVVPFVIGKNCFSYGRGYVYRKDAIGYIKRSNNSYTWQSYELQNKEKKTFFLFYVEAVSEKSFGLAPLALNQEQEAKAFLDTMTQWMSEVNC